MRSRSSRIELVRGALGDSVHPVAIAVHGYGWSSTIFIGQLDTTRVRVKCKGECALAFVRRGHKALHYRP